MRRRQGRSYGRPQEDYRCALNRFVSISSGTGLTPDATFGCLPGRKRELPIENEGAVQDLISRSQAL